MSGDGNTVRLTFESRLASLTVDAWLRLNAAAEGGDADARAFLERVRAGALAAVFAGYAPSLADLDTLGEVDLGALGWARSVADMLQAEARGGG